jgi:DUF1365 family protein
MPIYFRKPLLIKGEIMHHRFFPKKNSFKYNSIYISFPIIQINKLRNKVFSVNKFNLFSFYNKDYGANNYNGLTSSIENILNQNQINNIKNIILFTHPRILGYVFNPVSFWLCLDENNNLIAVLSEVNNRNKQRHNYFCVKEGSKPINSNEWLESKKEFYVSPFMEIEGKYKFKFERKKNQMNFYINYLVDDKLKLSTYLKCNFLEFNVRNLIILFCKIPFATLKTTTLIHYQALKLFSKKIKFYKCPKQIKNLTISKNGAKNS